MLLLNTRANRAHTLAKHAINTGVLHANLNMALNTTVKLESAYVLKGILKMEDASAKMLYIMSTKKESVCSVD